MFTLVLLHGWGGSSKSLEPLAKELINLKYNVINLELPGHGTTAPMDRPWNMNDFGKWLKSKIDGLDLSNLVLVGHSFGGKTIIEAVTSKLIRPYSIALIDANGIKPHNSLKTKFWKFLSSFKIILQIIPFGEKLKKFIYRHIIGEVDYYKTKNNENIRESFRNFNNEHYDDKLNLIDVPTLIIWGKHDKVTPLWMGEKLHDGIKNSKLFIVDSTHGLPLKKPEEVSNIIHNFLQND